MVADVSPVLERLSPQDLYRQIDWLRDEWNDHEEVVAKKIVRLRRTLEHLPSRYYERSVPLVESLCRARLVRNADYLPTLRALGELVSEWDRNRPPLLTCEMCGVNVRGRDSMNRHLWLVHDIEEGMRTPAD